MPPPTPSQRYLSTRGGTYDFSFESVVLKGLASDGGLFIPETIPSLPSNWQDAWRDLSFQDLAYEIFCLYICEDEIPRKDLRTLVDRSYGVFRAEDVTPLRKLSTGDEGVWLLELFHGPTFAFKDVALQFVGNLFEYFLVRRNEGLEGDKREHLTVVGATSGDTGSAAIYGLRGKKDVSVFIMHPKGKVSPIQEAQMTTVLDSNVHNIAVEGTFDDCQDIVKALFADEETNAHFRLAAVNSINWARILAQITYYFHSYFSLSRQTNTPNPSVRFVVPTGNFGDILAGYFATRMGLPTAKLVVATNENDILHRFWQSGYYEKKPVHGQEAEGGLVEDGVKAASDGVKETLSPAMDILVSSNFERLLWFLAFETSDVEEVNRRRMEAGEKVKAWLGQLKSEGGFGVGKAILEQARATFESQRISDDETIRTIRDIYSHSQFSHTNGTTNGTHPATTGTEISSHYILDPHSAIGIAACARSLKSNPESQHISLATAHPAKFSHAVELALREKDGFAFEKVLPREFEGMLDLERRVTTCQGDWKKVREVVVKEVEEELKGKK